MKKFKILMPCYNDWPSIFKLLENIDKEILELKGEFSVLIVNDGSNEKMPETKKVYKNIKSVKVINMKKNQGHTRSNATGIRYLSKKENFDYLILMDGDGEDRPEEIKLMVDKVLKNEGISVVAKRVKRSEGLIFSILYNIHKLITLVFTGRNMNFGHYSCLTKKDVDVISLKESLWGNYSGTVKKFISNLDNIPCIRGLRYVQPSKMSFIKLVIHSFSILAVFKYQVLLRSILLSIALLLFFSNFITHFIVISLIVFTICVFILSRRENIEGLKNSENQIAGIISVYTKRL
tara:strand:+ start:231 stop:1106 length:876 start_codon:yes stop_codon:yes gene_type:complete